MTQINMGVFDQNELWILHREATREIKRRQWAKFAETWFPTAVRIHIVVNVEHDGLHSYYRIDALTARDENDAVLDVPEADEDAYYEAQSDCWVEYDDDDVSFELHSNPQVIEVKPTFL